MVQWSRFPDAKHAIFKLYEHRVHCIRAIIDFPSQKAQHCIYEIRSLNAHFCTILHVHANRKHEKHVRTVCVCVLIILSDKQGLCIKKGRSCCNKEDMSVIHDLI